MGRRMAKTSVPPANVLQHLPFPGTVISVVDHHGHSTDQVTLAGTAVTNGPNIDLLVRVKPFTPDDRAIASYPRRTLSR